MCPRYKFRRDNGTQSWNTECIIWSPCADTVWHCTTKAYLLQWFALLLLRFIVYMCTADVLYYGFPTLSEGTVNAPPRRCTNATRTGGLRLEIRRVYTCGYRLFHRTGIISPVKGFRPRQYRRYNNWRFSFLNSLSCPYAVPARRSQSRLRQV